MKATFLTAIAATLFLALPAGARPTYEVIEDGREVAASMITLPTVAGGMLDVLGCTGCKRLTFKMAPQVQFFIGRQEVTLPEFKRHLESYPSEAVLLVSPRAQMVVTRLTAMPAK